MFAGAVSIKATSKGKKTGAPIGVSPLFYLFFNSSILGWAKPCTISALQAHISIQTLRKKTIILPVCMTLWLVWEIASGAIIITSYYNPMYLELCIFSYIRDVFFTVVLVVLLMMGKSEAFWPGYAQAQVNPMVQSQLVCGKV